MCSGVDQSITSPSPPPLFNLLISGEGMRLTLASFSYVSASGVAMILVQALGQVHEGGKRPIGG